MEAYQSLPEGTLAELIEGILYMSPAPTPYHQRTLANIFRQIDAYVLKENIGELFISPIDVYLDEVSNVVQPDILFLEHNGRTEVSRNGIHGTPTLIVEILSPGNSNHDIVIKKLLYERFGVKEYWIVEPESKQTTGFYLQDGIYQSIPVSFGKLNSRFFNQEFTF
jgi:Uma2 family endonuclease